MRPFVHLRWAIAPGFYKQPAISIVLSQKDRSAQSRFEELVEDRFADSWEDAKRFDDPAEWREGLWEIRE
jgi:hypothetical protein